MSDVRSLHHAETGTYVHLKDLLSHLIDVRDRAEAAAEHAVAATFDRLIVELATPFMIRDGVQATGEVPAQDVSVDGATALHTEPEQGDAHQ